MRVFGFIVLVSLFGLALVGAVAIVAGVASAPAQDPDRATGAATAARPTAMAAGADAATAGKSDDVTTSTFAASASHPVALVDGVRRQSGAGTTTTLQISLAAGEAFVGQSYGFEGRMTGCRAWIVAGPFTGDVTVTDGEWFAFTGTRLSAEQANDLLGQVIARQIRQGYGCDESNVQVDRVGGLS